MPCIQMKRFEQYRKPVQCGNHKLWDSAHATRTYYKRRDIEKESWKGTEKRLGVRATKPKKVPMIKFTATDAACLFGNGLRIEISWKCGRWIHEDCEDKETVNSDATKLCPLS